MADTYMTAEELLDVLAEKVADAQILKDSIMSVSYTHLDVYKRQVYPFQGPQSAAKRLCLCY